MLISGQSESPLQLLREEFRQRGEEGTLIPAELSAELAALDREKDAWNEAAISAIRAELEACRRDPDFSFEEPNGLDEIRARRPERRRPPELALSDDELLDRFHGAWLGRSVGCALGKPVEGMGMSGGWKAIRALLKSTGDWPLRDYFRYSDKVDCRRSCRDCIEFMESDDDIRYTLMGLLIMEKHGRDFTWRDVAWLWENQFTMAQLCTAECQAALNYNLCGGRMNRPVWDVDRIRTFNNPFREWIGAQIRADFFGWACAGNPELAAELAWRDASWTHVKNGIYGEMFVAALEAAAFVEDDPVRLIETGLGEIPRDCRLAAALRNALAEIPHHDGMESFMQYVDAEFGSMSAVHTINNAVVCAAALIYGGMNPDTCVCAAVTGGLDTDCNGATVGAITGIAAGHRRFGGTLAGRLNDTIQAEFGEFRSVKMASLAERTLRVHRGVNPDRRSRRPE